MNPKSSSNDLGGVRLKYLHPVLYKQAALDNLKNMKFLSDSYREHILRHIAECDKEIMRTAK